MSWLVLKLVSSVCSCHSVAVYWPLGAEFGGRCWVHLRQAFAFSSSPYWQSWRRSQYLRRSLGLKNSPESKVWFWTTQSGTGGLKSQAYSEFQSLDWMVQKPLWSNMFGPEAHNSGCLLVGPYMSFTPRNDPSSTGEGAGLKTLVLPLPRAVSALKPGASKTQPQCANTQPLLFTFKKINHIWLFSILLLHFYCHLQNSSEGQRKPFCLTYLIF